MRQGRRRRMRVEEPEAHEPHRVVLKIESAQ